MLWRVLVGLVVLALATGCAIGPSQRPPVATVDSDGPAAPEADDPALPPPPPPVLPPLVPTSPALDFVDCTASVLAEVGATGAAADRDLRVGCATLPVGGLASGTGAASQVDVSRVTLGPAPPGPVVPVAVLGDPGRRTGTAEAVTLASRAPVSLLDGRALYGVDVRGSLGGTVDCITPRTRAALVDADPAAADPVSLAPLADAAATAARTCSQLLEDSVTEYSTATYAEDLEEVRESLGAARLHAVGVGRGAGLLARWAQDHPGAQGRLVLDGLPDLTAPAAVTAGLRAEAASAAFDAFATDCVARGDCPLGPDPRTTVTELVARLRAAPLPATASTTSSVVGREVTAGTVVTTLVDRLGVPGDWPRLATVLAATGRGDPEPLLAVREEQENADAAFDLGLVTRCNDDAERLAVDQVAAAAGRAAAGDPLFGAWYAQRSLLCSSWPVPTDPPSPLTGTAVPALLLGTAADPLTPLSVTRRAGQGLAGSVLVAWLGAGHGAYPTTPCISDVVDEYLVRGEVPRTGTVCPP